jgi:subtilisin family serine protease
VLLAPDSSYQFASGTSFAAAHVSGVVALLLERKPGLTPADVRKLLVSTARPLGRNAGDHRFGAGLVDAFQALRAIGGVL